MVEQRHLSVVQVLPALEMGGVERGTLEVARRLVQEGHRSTVISAGGRLVEQLEAEGSTHLDWDVGAKRLATLRWIPRLRRFLREARPDVMHLRSRLPAWIAYRAWKGLPSADRPALITTVHGFYTPGWYSSVMVRGERIIAISESVKEYILKNYPSAHPSHIRVIPRGVDPQVYRFGYRPSEAWLREWYTKYPQLQGNYVATLPARLTRLKGQEDLLEIIAALKDSLPIYGLIVGGAHANKLNYQAELMARARALGVERNIVFTGHRQDLKEIMAVSNVVLSMSKYPEAFGRTVIEALSMGVPVVGYDHGGVGEQLAAIFPEGRVPRGDIRQVRERLSAWYGTPPRMPSRHAFTLERMLAATLGVYREAVAARAG